MADEIPSCKPQVIDVLQMLASENEQLDYEHNVPHVDITGELLCQWGNDTYHPKWTHFRSSFTQRELEILAAFDEFFQKRRIKLPKSHGTVRTWLASPVWREVMNEAQKTLDQISK